LRDHGDVGSVVLVLPSTSYRTTDFVRAASDLGLDIAVATEGDQTFAAAHPDQFINIDLTRPRRGAATILEWARGRDVDGVLAVDDLGVITAALAGRDLGLVHNDPAAVASTRNKAMMRRALKDVVAQPSFTMLESGTSAAAAVRHVGAPAVIKPLSLSASRGVIKVDHPDDAEEAARVVRRILATAGGNPNESLIVERFIRGPEVAIDGLLVDGTWHTLGVFDKPVPMDGPYFAETIFTTPSRHHPEVVAEIERVAATAATRLGLTEGAVHAEVRVHGSTVVFLELAARSIGGLCGRALRFGLMDTSLESVLLRHAIGRPPRAIRRVRDAAGVAMVPVPAPGRFRGFRGTAAAAAIPGVTAVDITTNPGRRVRPLPFEGTYLGFVFAAGDDPAAVERSLVEAMRVLDVAID
jgi:biotin carboxylase